MIVVHTSNYNGIMDAISILIYAKNMHVFMSSTINLVFGMFVLSINAKKYKNIYIYT